MHYSYEFKLECVQFYKKTGTFPTTPKKVKPRSFKDKVRIWVRLYDKHGAEVLKRSNEHKNWTPEDKLVLINQYKNGKSINTVAIDFGINEGLLYSWIRKYEKLGYNGLVNNKKGRSRMNADMSKKITKQRELTESELEELIRLRERCAYLEAESEAIKKEIALREEKEAAQLKAKKQRLLKNLEKKDIN